MNEDGMTLIELLCAFALFTILTTVFLGLFQHYATMTNRTSEQVSAVGIVEQVAYYVDRSPQTFDQLEGIRLCQETDIEKVVSNGLYLVEESDLFQLDDSNQVYYRTENNDRFYPSIVQHCATAQEYSLGLIPLVIELYRLDKDGTKHIVAETFRYLDVEKAL